MASSAKIPIGAPMAGEIFAGKYRIDRALGKGGMGLVLAATHQQLREKVAIKVLLPDSARDAETLQRFVREAQAAVKIKSEHVGRVFDYGVDADRPYIVMEYLDGQDLSRALRERGPLPVSLAVDWVLQALEAVAEAHACKIIHRDLKPSNLFLVKDTDGHDVIKVLDFGISKFTQEEAGVDLVATKTSALLGSPLYMSPEQLRSSKSVTPQSDIWAVGVILYELVAGVVPFAAMSLPELGALVLSGPTPWLHQAVPGCPVEFSQVVATCLAKDPADRYASVLDLANALAPFGSAGASPSLEKIALYFDDGTPPPVPAPVAAVSASPPLQRTERMPRPSAPGDPLLVARPPAPARRAWPIAASLLGVIVLAGVAAQRWVRLPTRRAVVSAEPAAPTSAPTPVEAVSSASATTSAEPTAPVPPAASSAPHTSRGQAIRVVRKSVPSSSAPAASAPQSPPSSGFANSRTWEN